MTSVTRWLSFQRSDVESRIREVPMDSAERLTLYLPTLLYAGLSFVLNHAGCKCCHQGSLTVFAGHKSGRTQAGFESGTFFARPSGVTEFRVQTVRRLTIHLAHGERKLIKFSSQPLGGTQPLNQMFDVNNQSMKTIKPSVMRSEGRVK